MWSKGDEKTTRRGNALYNFIMGKSIPFKTTSVHLFMPGNFSGIEEEFGGVACDYQCNRWSTTIGVYYKYINSDPTNRNHWDPGKTFCHELGHNFGLYHTFAGDNCSDTPPLCKKCTNNMMDYEEVESLTQCQLSKMHKWLETYTTIVKTGLPNYTMSGQIAWSGGSASLLPVLNNVPDPQITVDINAPGATNFSWTYVNGNGNWSTNSTGTVTNVNIAQNDYMEFDVETLANCQTVEETYVFIHQPYLLYPNPVQDQLQIKQNRKFIEIASRHYKKSEQRHDLKIYNQYKKILFESKLKSDFDVYSLDVTDYKSGWYYVELDNAFFTKTYKFQKL